MIATVPTAADASYYAGIVAEKALLRRLVQAGTRIAQYGYSGADDTCDVDTLVDRAQAEVYDLTATRSSSDLASFDDLLQPTLDEISCAPAGTGGRGVPTGFTELDELTQGLQRGQMITVAGRPGVGKALALDTPLPTRTGWTTMAAASVGDSLLDAAGRPTRIVAANDVMYERPCYEIEFGDATTIVADHSHEWPTPDGITTSAGLRPHMRVHAPQTRRGQHTAAQTVSRIRSITSVAVRCVEVDNPEHLYLAGAAMVPTHNSTLGLDFLRSCSIRHRKPSALFSLEMSKSEIVMRLLSAEAGIRLADIRTGRLSDLDWARLGDRISGLSEAPLYIDDSPTLTLMEIRAKARRLRQRTGLRLLIVDYLRLMTSGKRFESRQQEVSDISRNLKLLAKEPEIPVVAVSQLNRGPELRHDKTPVLADLRGSDQIEQVTHDGSSPPEHTQLPHAVIPSRDNLFAQVDVPGSCRYEPTHTHPASALTTLRRTAQPTVRSAQPTVPAAALPFTAVNAQPVITQPTPRTISPTAMTALLRPIPIGVVRLVLR